MKDNDNEEKEKNNVINNDKNSGIILSNDKNEKPLEDENNQNKNNINYNNLILYEPKSTTIEILKEDKKTCDLHFKVIVIGNSGVGKSCLSLKATQDIFKEDYISTIGFEFFSFNIKINNKIVKLQIWDTCGQEIYRSLISGFYRSTQLGILVYSVTDRKSFEEIEVWLKQIKTHGTPDCKIFLIGNKIDLPNRVVSSEEGINCKNEHNFECYMETSAKTGVNIRELFINGALTLYTQYLKKGRDEEQYNYEVTLNDNVILNNDIKDEENDCQC